MKWAPVMILPMKLVYDHLSYFALSTKQEVQKSKQLEDSMRKLDHEIKRTDDLLYQMIPRQVADKLRRGEPATDTCEVSFESENTQCI